MDIERKNAVTMKGNPFTLVGPEIKVGQKAPDFAVLGSDPSPVTLASSQGNRQASSKSFFASLSIEVIRPGLR